METLGYRLSAARKNAGLTQAQVGEKLFVTPQAVSYWEHDNNVPDMDKLGQLSDLYGVTTDWLLKGTRPDPKVMEITAGLSDRLFNENRMVTYITGYCNARQLHQTLVALNFAREKHDGQFRLPGHGEERVPYVYHPLMLACHALALGLEDDDLLSVCLLHDVCEDCGVALEELPVSEAAREAVGVLTKPADFQKTEEENNKYYSAIADNRIATMVKLLDRCNNVSSMAGSFSNEKLADYMQETMQYVFPLLRQAKHSYPCYSNQLFLLRYHMQSVIDTLRHYMKMIQT